MMNLLADLRFGLRLIGKSPGFAAIVIIVLALGIGANTAIFSIVDAVLLRGLPYRDAQRLVMIWEKNPNLGALIGDRVPTAPATFREWQKRATRFEAVEGFEDANLNLTGGAEPERVDGARASAGFFELLGVHPQLGSTFAFAERDPDRAHVAVLSNEFFQSHFGAATDSLGKIIRLNDIDYTIVGVLPRGFHLPASREGGEQRKPLIWVPYDGSERANETEFHRRKMQVFGRLKSDVSLAQARAEMEAVAQQLATEDPTQHAGFSASVFPLYVEDVGRDLRRNLFVLLAAVGFVLLIACANVANLMLTRAGARRKEMAIRKALGATRAGLVRQMLIETLLLSGIGAVFGLVLASYGMKALLALHPVGINRPEDIHLSGPVLIFTTGISMLAALICGMVPAWQAARTDVNETLHQTRGTHSFVSGRVRKFLIGAEIAAASVLLVGAAFMMKSLLAVAKVDPGYRVDHLLTMKFSMPPSRYGSNEAMAAFCRQAVEKVVQTPGVSSASFSDGLPLTRLRLTKFTVEGQPEPARGSEPTADMRGIFNAAYFDALGIRLIEGRNFTDDELQNKRPVLVVNRALARKLWPNQSAVGEHLRSVPSKANPTPIVSTVIGVVADTHQTSMEDEPRPEVTKPMQDFTQLTLAVRSTEPPDAMIPRVKNAIWSVDRYLPVFEVQTMEQIVTSSTSERRFESFLMSIFAGLALVLAAVGIYGVLSSLVGQRTQEIGVRIALGAQHHEVMRMVAAEGLRVVVGGLAVGIAGAVVLIRSLASLFFGVTPANALTYIEVALLLFAIALIATLIPAWRAARLNPIDALRYE